MRYILSSPLIFISLLFIAISGSGQQLPQFDARYYAPPMDDRLLLSANFAEARTDHFHSGIDVKTGGTEGRKVYAVADGYISRIGVSPTGFGRVLYIDHPNGTTTVYGHMQRFTPEVENFVTSERYRLKLHRVDLYPEAGKLPVTKGQLIGYSGNSGSSQGPHLHFEIREAPAQRPVNVAKLGIYDLKDDIRPRIVRLHYIETDTVKGVPVHSAPKAVEVKSTVDGVYTLSDTSALELGPNGYFVLEATDRKDDTQNTMGLYSVRMSVDGEQTFSFYLNSFLFTEQRYVNSLTHYGLQKGSRNELLRLAVQENNKLPVYSGVKERGAIILPDTAVRHVDIVAEDDNGNISTLGFKIRLRVENPPFHTEEQTEGIPVCCKRAFTRSLDGLSVSIPAGALYDPIFYTQSSEDPETGEGGAAGRTRYSPIYTIHNDNTPLQTAITVSIDVPGAPQELRDKLCLARVSQNGTLYSNTGGKYGNGRVVGSTRSFGRYCVVADDTPPTISSSFTDGADLRSRNSLSFTLRDDFAGVASFTATIDGQWVLFEQKGAVITHTFDPSRIDYSGQKHDVVITVTDGKNNSATLRTSFVK